MSKQDLELLIESEQMRATITALKSLAENSDGVMIDGTVVPWVKAFPLLSLVPDFNATEAQKKLWMESSVAAWEARFYERLEKVVSHRLSLSSSTENDNIYFWSLFATTSKVLKSVRNNRDFKHLLGDSLSQVTVNSLVASIDAVTAGSQTTAYIGNTLFKSGIDLVLMEFQKLESEARISKRTEDEKIYKNTVEIIKGLRELNFRES